MYLLDTNHCSRIIHGDPVVINRLLEQTGTNIATSVISCGELIFMAQKSERKIENTLRIEKFLQGIQIVSIDAEIAHVYGEIKSALLDMYGPREKAKRRRMSTSDLGFDENDIWIAASSLRLNSVLVSSDTDFPRIHKAVPLIVESWWTPGSN